MNYVSFNTTRKEDIYNKSGVGYLQFRDTLSPKYNIVWLEIISNYIVLIIILSVIAVLQESVWWSFCVTVPIGGFVVGYIVASLNLFMHEASHYHLTANRTKNDLLANLFLGLAIGMDVNFYRSVHFVHHRLIGTKNDTEKSYFEPLSWRFFFEALTGLRIIKVMLHRNKNIRANYGSKEGEEIVHKNNLFFLLALLSHLTLLCLLFLAGFWAAVVAWILGMGYCLPLSCNV
jgi:fatty acid desaturase